MDSPENLTYRPKDYIACAYLFSPELARQDGFLENLKLSTLKSAFRTKAKRYHPDLHLKESDEMIIRRQDRFTKIIHSYEYLFSRLNQNSFKTKRPEVTETGKAKIIAVGGAKGGIGKSILSSNLSVYLSQKGFDTVAVDLDLGGANLHLFLGKPVIKYGINDFLAGSIKRLEDTIESTQYGPGLIGGNSSHLGAANISFSKKLKLIKALRKIPADYIIMDLGGDTSFNIIDCFLAADVGIVMTTCDPASYLDAYSFIKVAVYRKLTRLYGPEQALNVEKDPVLKQMISDTLTAKKNKRAGNIEQLIQRIKKEHPAALKTIQDVLSHFSPQLLVNKVENSSEAMEPVGRIQTVARRKLGIDVEFLCSLPLQNQIRQSARTLVPWISNGADSQALHSFGIIEKTIQIH